MIKRLKQRIKSLAGAAASTDQHELLERLLLANGKQLASWVRNLKNLPNLEDAEFRIFSQFGDDGIIQYLVNHIEMPSKTFIEFGVGDYSEANTRFLLMNDNWSGFVLDSSAENLRQIKSSSYYWAYELAAEQAFINVENINALLAHRTFGEVGLLHIDIDGNDYWIWQTIDSISPALVIVEYNSLFGADRAITIPYDSGFQRTRAHYSNLYFGASLPALTVLAGQKDYAFVGSNSAGNNAYFVRRDLVNSDVKEISVKNGYRLSRFRESRNKQGNLTYVSGAERLRLITGLPVFNVETKQIETL